MCCIMATEFSMSENGIRGEQYTSPRLSALVKTGAANFDLMLSNHVNRALGWTALILLKADPSIRRLSDLEQS